MEKDKLIKEITEYFDTIEDGTVTVDVVDSICKIHLCKMYQGLGDWVSFKNLSWLSKLLNTDNINLENDEYSSGCETCDYGSSHEVDIVCKDIKI